MGVHEDLGWSAGIRVNGRGRWGTVGDGGGLRGTAADGGGLSVNTGNGDEI